MQKPVQAQVSLEQTKNGIQSHGATESHQETAKTTAESALVFGPTMEPSDQPSSSAPTSPYTSTRAMIRDLTLPTVPNFDIPPSPPGSPPPEMEAVVARFAELKRQGLHYNEKLASNPSMKNPSLLGKMMQNAGLDDSDQYGSALPAELWDPSGFPSWAYVEALGKAQQAAQKQREEDVARKQRDAIDFVPAAGSGQSSKAATPASKGSGKSAAERVMAGLDRERPASRFDVAPDKRRRSRSPKRRR